VDQRILTVTHTAGSFTPIQVRSLEARTFVITASIRGEVGLDLILDLRKKGAWLAADVQGFARVIASDGVLVYEPWPRKEEVLSHIDVVKTDAVEAEMLTGTSDRRAAAQLIAGWGPKEVVVTHRSGVLVFADGEFYEAPFHPKQLVGRSGRGDTCIASYLAKRQTASPGEATIWSAAVTSLKLEAEGPIRREMKDVEALIRTAYIPSAEVL
jgi:sugar/nucleoside kinase (ribokinase family)